MPDISLATFNLYNLQLPGKPWRGDRPYTDEQYKAKIAWTADMLRKLDADVIAFQELWSPECLRDAFAAADLAQDYVPHYIKAPVDAGDPWVSKPWYDIAVAVAVRKRWTLKDGGKAVHKDFPAENKLVKRKSQSGEDDEVDIRIARFSRSVLELDLVRPDNPDVPTVKVFAAHLKSKLATQLDREELDDPAVKVHARGLGMALSTVRRTAEASALRVILTKAMKGTNTPVAVLGDFNDGPLSNTLSIISNQPPFRLYAKSRTGKKNDVGLYAAGALEDMSALRDVQFTHEFDGVLDSLDHVLVSEQFYDHSENRLWSFRKARVWNDHVEDTDKATSDHGVVAAYFDYNPAK